MEIQLELPIQDRGISTQLSSEDKALVVSSLAEAMIGYLKEMDKDLGEEHGSSQTD